ncbi:MAG: hypothetical protein EB015_18915 [Methylocystaceae bacterium]|nr:hypothetical protein [Methylocystaceae bacterium]
MKSPPSALSDWVANAGATIEFYHGHNDSSVMITRWQGPRPPDMCYLTSLRSHFFDYPALELGLGTWRGRVMQLGGQVAWLCGFDCVSLIANEPFSTNLRSAEQKAQIPDTAVAELHAHPHNWVGVRNLLPEEDGALLEALRERAFVFLPTRVVYLFDARKGRLARSSHLIRDRKNLAKSHLQCCIDTQVTDTDLKAIHQLYHDIYITKHSKLNARYTLKFFHDMICANHMPCLRVYDHSTLVAFALLYQKADQLVVPAVGHARDENNKGYYRSLFAALADYVEQNKLLLNYSSGAGDFKRRRGGVPVLEWTAIHAPRHSRFKQRLIRVVADKAKIITMEMMMASGA